MSSTVVIPIETRARNPGREQRRRRADQLYARQAAWFEARAEGPGHYSRRCAYCGGWFYGARSTATYCRPSCRGQARKRRIANRTAQCPGCGKAFQTQGRRRVFCGDAWIALRLADVSPRTSMLTVGDWTIPLGERERELLRAWIGVRGRAHGPLFQPVNKGGRIARRVMSGQAVAQVVAERAAEARLGKLSPEDLRRAHLPSSP